MIGVVACAVKRFKPRGDLIEGLHLNERVAKMATFRLNALMSEKLLECVLNATHASTSEATLSALTSALALYANGYGVNSDTELQGTITPELRRRIKAVLTSEATIDSLINCPGELELQLKWQQSQEVHGCIRMAMQNAVSDQQRHVNEALEMIVRFLEATFDTDSL